MLGTKVNGKLFTCPACGCHYLEEIMVCVTQSSFILEVEGEDVEYGDSEANGGVIDRIQCLKCGFLVVEESESPNPAYQELGFIAERWTQPEKEEN